VNTGVSEGRGSGVQTTSLLFVCIAMGALGRLDCKVRLRINHLNKLPTHWKLRKDRTGQDSDEANWSIYFQLTGSYDRTVIVMKLNGRYLSLSAALGHSKLVSALSFFFSLSHSKNFRLSLTL